MTMIHDLLGPVARWSLTHLSRRRLPQTEGTLTVPGLAAPVEVVRDRWGIPHLYAATLPGLFFAQGFVWTREQVEQEAASRLQLIAQE